jgi:LEA14-like dessication related protein
MMKRIFLWCAIVCAATQAWAGPLPTPKAEMKRFDVKSISLRDITFLFELQVTNPYPVALKFSGMTLVFSVEGTKVFTAASQGGFSIPANGARSNAFDVTLAYDDIIKVVKDYASRDVLSTTINGTLEIPLPNLPLMPGLPKSVSFKYTLKKDIPAIKPQLAIVDFSVLPPTKEQVGAALKSAGRKVDPGKALGALNSLLKGKKPEAPPIDPSDIDVPISVSFTIELANEAKAELSFAKLGYTLFVNGDKLVVGESGDVKRDAGRALITVKNTFSSKSLSQGVREALQKRAGTFKLVGSASLQLPESLRAEPLPLAFTETGSFSFK